jgi:hypothetical protein
MGEKKASITKLYRGQVLYDQLDSRRSDAIVLKRKIRVQAYS